jgi:nitronate monooxygenase
MAGASTLEMSASLANRGALASIPLGSFSENPQHIRKQLNAFNKLLIDQEKGSTVNLNFFAHEAPVRTGTIEDKWIEKYKAIYAKNGITWSGRSSLSTIYPTFKTIKDIEHDTVRSLIELSPKIVSFHFGIPDVNILKHLQKHGISIFITATSLSEFEQLLEAGVDGVILQGWEAGGHRGNFQANDLNDEKLSTEELVTTIIKSIDSSSSRIEKIPWLVAAGGIVDSETIQKFLDLGIAGVQLGTVWLPSSTSRISAQQREHFHDPQGRKTIMNPAISGRNLRTIESPFLKELMDGVQVEDIPAYPLPYDIFKQLNSDAKDSDGEFQGLLAGSGFFRAWKGTTDIDEIFDSLVKDLRF